MLRLSSQSKAGKVTFGKDEKEVDGRDVHAKGMSVRLENFG